MKKIKIVILGRGTAGVMSAGFFNNQIPNAEIDWIYDPNISPQAVGEGLNLGPVYFMTNFLDFRYQNLNDIDGTFKCGILKDGWGDGNQFFHDFEPPAVAFHINAVKYQNWVFEKLKKENTKINFIEANVSCKNIDADIIVDCSGKPDEELLKAEFNIAKNIPVNSVYVTQCFWDSPKFQYSLTNAAKHGWYFGIPLQNRCAIGYLYNNKLSTLEEIKEDVKYVFEKYGLTPSNFINSFSFKNYYRKNNYTNTNITYNGNASFFLEPLEATTIGMQFDIIKRIKEIKTKKISIEQANELYNSQIEETYDMIMLHYFAGSKYESNFWDHVKSLSKNHIVNSLTKNNKQNKFYKIIERIIDRSSVSKSLTDQMLLSAFNDIGDDHYGTWPARSYFINIEGLKLREKLIEIL